MGMRKTSALAVNETMYQGFRLVRAKNISVNDLCCRRSKDGEQKFANYGFYGVQRLV